MKGELIWNPGILATGKTRRAILRKHAQLLWNAIMTVEDSRQELSTSLRKRNKYNELVLNNPNYWIDRGNSACIEEALEDVLSLARYYEKHGSLEVGLALLNYENALSIKSNHADELWIILRVDPKEVIAKLDELRLAGLRISASAWGPHISVVRNEQIDPSLIGTQANTMLEFEASTTLRHNKQGYYWYDVTSLELEAFRNSLGLPPRPNIGLHLTLGRTQ